jgi:hypothetical protein
LDGSQRTWSSRKASIDVGEEKRDHCKSLDSGKVGGDKRQNKIRGHVFGRNRGCGFRFKRNGRCGGEEFGYCLPIAPIFSELEARSSGEEGI